MDRVVSLLLLSRDAFDLLLLEEIMSVVFVRRLLMRDKETDECRTNFSLIEVVTFLKLIIHGSVYKSVTNREKKPVLYSIHCYIVTLLDINEAI